MAKTRPRMLDSLLNWKGYEDKNNINKGKAFMAERLNVGAQYLNTNAHFITDTIMFQILIAC